MEKLDGMVDRETLKSRYLFPAIPCDKSVWEQVLSYQLVACSGKAEGILYNIRKVMCEVELALGMADLSLAEEKLGLKLDITDSRIAKGEINFKSLFADLDKAKGKQLDMANFWFLLGANNPPHRIDGRDVDYFKDISGKKYVMACVLSVPDCFNSLAWEVAIKSGELYAQRKDDFECIIFLRKRLDGWEEFASLQDFLKPFDPSCIIFPLDEDSSAYIQNNRVLVIDPNNRVLLCCPLKSISHVGSAAFPFKESDVTKLWQQYWHLNHSSLESLLGVEPSHKLFRKIPGTDPDPLPEEWRCISEFRSKIVFLYTYHQGNGLALLYDTVKGLREKGIMEYEIITAYVPSCEYRNPVQFLKVFSSLVAKHGLSWWVVPYDSSTYPRLKPLYAINTSVDQLIVFDPKIGDDGDPHGLEVMELYGPDMFPFTKKSVVEHIMKEISQITLQSLFEPVTHLCKEDPECDNNVCENKSKSVLEGRDVLVYFDKVVSGSSPLDKYVSWYNSLGEKEKETRRNDFEVVCVYLDMPKQDEYNVDSRRQIPKWLISSDEDEKAYAKHVVDNFFLKLFKREFTTIVAFGKDGKICSLCAHRLLSSSSSAVTFPPFSGDLPEEIFNIFNDYFSELLSID